MAGRVAPAVISDSIIFYLDAGNTKSKSDYSTNWNDLSRNQYVFSATNSTFNEKYIPTMTFLGTSQSYARTTQTTPELPSQVTYNVWLRSAQKSRDQYFFSDGGQNTNPRTLGYFALAWRSGQFRLQFDYANTTYSYGAIAFYNFFTDSQNEWINVTLSVDYTATELIRLYKNGILFATASFYEAPYYSPTASVFPVPTPRAGLYKYVGSYAQGSGNGFQGDISIAQIYGRLLSADEVLRNYNAMLPRHSWTPGISTDGLQLYLDPADKRSYPGTGTVLTDLSPNGYTFSMIDATYNSLNKGNILYNGTSSLVASAKTFALYNQTSFNFWERSDIIGSTVSQMFIGDSGQTKDATGTYSFGYVSMYRLQNALNYQSAYGGPVWQTMQSSNFFLGYTASDWVNVTVTADYDNRITKFYKNGQLNATFSMTGTPIVPRNLNKYIGCWYAGTNPNFAAILKGNIGVFTIYNRILTADEIYNDYQALRGRYSAKEI